MKNSKRKMKTDRQSTANENGGDKDPDVDRVLNLWFSNVTAQGVRVYSPMLKLNTETLAQKMAYNFTATDAGWLNSNLGNAIRHEFKKAHREK